MITVILLGSGNVATHLFKAFMASEQTTVKQLYSRNIKSIQQYSSQVAITDSLSELEDADVYILAVSDDAIRGLSAKLPFKNRLVLHTSGTVNVHDLDGKNQRGVFYPLQTFSKSAAIDFKNVPFCIEVAETSNLPILKQLAKALGSPCYKVNPEQRQALHLAAVFVNNFVNQLYRVAHEVSETESVEFEILKPLILETAKKVQNISPYMAQTGPAIRDDKKTIERHLDLLKNDHHKDIYKLLTTSIQKTHNG
jgi:predicted short-subunit dehydrogenase-like oxidoreductase (DUF2520 family)